MMHVRTQTLRGEYVQARLKASAISIADTASAMPFWPSPAAGTPVIHAPDGTPLLPVLVPQYPTTPTSTKPVSQKGRNGSTTSSNRRNSDSNKNTAQQTSSPSSKKNANNNNNKQKRKNSRTNNNKKNSSNNSSNNNNGNGNGNININNNSSNNKAKNGTPKQDKQVRKNSNTGSGKNEKPSLSRAPELPSFGEHDFPSLQEKQVEFDKIPADVRSDDDCCNKMSSSSTKSVSDAASTVTTSSSSMDSDNNNKKSSATLGGYAAALLNPSPAYPAKVTASSASNTTTKATPLTLKPRPSSPVAAPTEAGNDCEKQAEAKTTEADTPIVIKPPTWGRGRSFADILRTETSA